jgi:hypothetical protein
MKNIILILFVILGITTSFAQEESETSGDNFSLEGALEMFKKSSSLEEFEKLINSENNDVNNLDLNEDGDIDYINVESIKEGDTHVIILSTYLNDKDIQDIATIGIEKTGDEEAILQIEGDENLYAENTIVEPFDVESKVERNNYGPNESIIDLTRVVVNVWFWPCVKFMYHPRYVVWKSPFRWKKHPSYWKPWKPFTHSVFRARCVRHSTHFHKTKTHRVLVARKIYKPRRKVAVIKTHKKATVIKKRANARRR